MEKETAPTTPETVKHSTLIFIKPEGFVKKDEIIEQLAEAGFEIEGEKNIAITKKQIHAIYGDIKDENILEATHAHLIENPKHVSVSNTALTGFDPEKPILLLRISSDKENHLQELVHTIGEKTFAEQNEPGSIRNIFGSTPRIGDLIESNKDIRPYGLNVIHRPKNESEAELMEELFGHYLPIQPDQK